MTGQENGDLLIQVTA